MTENELKLLESYKLIPALSSVINIITEYQDELRKSIRQDEISKHFIEQNNLQRMS